MKNNLYRKKKERARTKLVKNETIILNYIIITLFITQQGLLLLFFEKL